MLKGESSPLTTSGLRDRLGEPIKGICLTESGLYLCRVPSVHVQESSQSGCG